MNVTVNLPAVLFERLASALERIAVAAERLAGPVTEPEQPKPFDPTLWMESSNAQSLQTEEEEQRERLGFGPAYERELETQAFGASDRADNPAR